MGGLGKMRVPRSIGLSSTLRNWAGRLATTGIVGAAGITGATAVTPSVFASTPEAAATRFQTFPDPSVVPPDIVQQAVDQGVARGPFIFRTQGVREDHSLFSPIQHPGRIMDLVVEGLNAVGIQAERATGGTYDWLKPLTAALLLAGISTVIMQDYRKRPLVGGVTTLGESVGLTGATGFLLMVGWIYTAPYTISALLRDGFVASSFRSNYGASTANFIVIGMWAFLGAWSLVSSLTFRLPGPVFKHIFMRDRTQHGPFMLAGGRYSEATAANVKAFLDRNGGKFAFSVEAAHLQNPKVEAAAQQLGHTPVTVKLSGLSYVDLLTMREVARQNAAQVTVTTVQNSRNRHITPGPLQPDGRMSVIVAGSRLRDDQTLQRWVDQGRAYHQQLKGRGKGRVVVLKQDVALSDVPSAGIFVLSGVLKHSTTTHGIPQKLSRDGSYELRFQGPANAVLPNVATAIAHRPFVSGVRPRALLFSPFHLTPRPVRSVLHRVMWPTTLTVEMKDPPSDEAVYDAMATIAGQSRYVVLPKAPLALISRAVVESVVADQQQIILTLKREDWERHTSAFSELADPTSVMPSPDYSKMVNVPVDSDAVLRALTQAGGDLLPLVRDGRVKLVIPAPLCTPQDVAKLSPHENVAIQVSAGDLTPLDDLRYPKQEGASAPWWRLVGRSVNQGPRFGRLPSIAAITVVGAPLSAPVTIMTKALTGYTDPATWIVSGLRVYLSGGVNMLFTPAVRGMVSAQRFNNYLAYLPGLLLLSVLYEPINDVVHNEPPLMWARSLMEDNSHEDRPGARRAQLDNLRIEEASITEPEGREFVLNYRLGNLLPTGYYTAKDVAILTQMVIQLQKTDSMAGDRLLAGLMADPGLVYLVNRDPIARSFFAKEIGAHRAGIEHVLHTKLPDKNSAELFSVFSEGR